MATQLETVQGRLAGGKHLRAEDQIQLAADEQRQDAKVSKVGVAAASKLLISKLLVMPVFAGLWITSVAFRVYSLGK